MTVVLGLLAALFYGVGDFAGGVASRRNGAITVLAWSYPVGAVLMTIMLPFFAGSLDGRVFGYGVAGGVAGMVGVVVMYGLMTVAPMNVVSPVTAVLAAIVPIAVGVSTGERPHVSAWFGILLGLAAITLVSRTAQENPHGRVGPRVLALALLSGLGFGFYFVFLARAGDHSGLWPLVVSRYASALLIIPLARSRGALVRPRGRRIMAIVLVAGACDALANMFFLLATHTGLLSLASVLTSLYPVTTVALAVTFLREHTSPLQRTGLVLAVGAIVLITV